MSARSIGWFMNLGTLGLVVYVAVGTVGGAIGYAMHMVPSVDDWAPVLALPDSLPARRSVDLDGIAERNLFGARREVLALADDQVAAPAEAPCSIAGRLRATIVSPDVPEWSVAVIIEPNANVPRVYFANSPITGDALLAAVNYRSVLIRNKGRIERCSLETDTSAAVQPVADITVVSTVERRTVDDCLANLAVCVRQARFVPTDDGVQIVAIKAAGVFDRIGLRNGDILLRINGHPMSELGRDFDALTSLREVSSVAIDVRRGGHEITLPYEIR